MPTSENISAIMKAVVEKPVGKSMGRFYIRWLDERKGQYFEMFWDGTHTGGYERSILAAIQIIRELK